MNGKPSPRRAPVGWLNCDKPTEMTSAHAVAIVKRLLRPKKIGHAGTLDPLATGVLPLALGEATKTVAYMMDAEKEYRFAVRFGVQTDTDDAEGQEIAASDARPTDAAIRAVLARFTGAIAQVPPVFSALKIDGQRAYDLAREGAPPEMKPRPVMIHRLEMTERPDADHAVFTATCGKGAYVRSLARDIALALGTRGHVATLRRTRVGPFRDADAVSLDRLGEMRRAAAASGSDLPWWKSVLAPPAVALEHIPPLETLPGDVGKILSGQPILLARADVATEEESEEPKLFRAMRAGRLLALVECVGREVTPVRVFATDAGMRRRRPRNDGA